jgi:hypothetical protein
MVWQVRQSFDVAIGCGGTWAARDVLEFSSPGRGGSWTVNLRTGRWVEVLANRGTI